MKNSASLLITGGRVIDPASEFDAVADVLIRDGKVEAVGTGLKADGLTVFPSNRNFVLLVMYMRIRSPDST